MMTKQYDHLPAAQAYVCRIADLIDASERTQVEIARMLGYSNANVVAMIKRGSMKLPAEKVVPLALILGSAPGAMLREWFETFEPELLSHVDKYMPVKCS